MQHGSFINQFSGNKVDFVPTVGMGCTNMLYSDRHAYTVIAVSASGKSCTVQRDKVKRVDTNGMSESQTYTYEADPEGSTTVVRLTKRGWRSKQCGKFAFGHRNEYHDFSF